MTKPDFHGAPPKLSFPPVLPFDEVELSIQWFGDPGKLPSRATPEAAGLDVYADCRPNFSVTIEPGKHHLVMTGFALAVPPGYEVQVRGRSGLASRGIVAFNGTIDSDYRGEVGVLLFNFSDEPYTVRHGDRIAQLVVSKLQSVTVAAVEALPESGRGTAGWGSTGK
jgi:dUTP pyrophosphatase